MKMSNKKWTARDPGHSSGGSAARAARSYETEAAALEKSRSPEVKLQVTSGPLRGNEYVFNRPSACMIGRAQDCDIQVSSENEDREVSRHHCLLEFIPPTVRLCDLGSTNGTFVNGERVGPRGPNARDELSQVGPFEVELKNGDEVRLGKTILRVSVDD